MKTYVIDRIINGIALCECLEAGENIEITPPRGAKEGDLIRQTKNGFEIDKEATLCRKKQLDDRLQRLFDKS